VAVSSSLVGPLPHQITAVSGDARPTAAELPPCRRPGCLPNDHYAPSSVPPGFPVGRRVHRRPQSHRPRQDYPTRHACG
jgi:hypothetical protein